MNIEKGLMTATPRRSKIGLLLFNTAFFLFKSNEIGIEITILSKRYYQGEGIKLCFFKVERWGLRRCKICGSNSSWIQNNQYVYCNSCGRNEAEFISRKKIVHNGRIAK